MVEPQNLSWHVDIFVSLFQDSMEAVHAGLDVIGFVPVIGEAADFVNALIYLEEGRVAEASLSLGSMVPIVGDIAFKGAKLGTRVARIGTRVAVQTGVFTAYNMTDAGGGMTFANAFGQGFAFAAGGELMVRSPALIHGFLANQKLVQRTMLGGAGLLGAYTFAGDVQAAPGAVPSTEKVAKLLRTAYRPHRAGQVGERLMGRWLRRFQPDEIIVAKPGAIGSNGSDWVTVNRQTGTVSLWDAKLRGRPRNVRMSSTFSKTGVPGVVRPSPLENAVGEAERIIRYQTDGVLTPAQRRAAVRSLEQHGTGFNLHTVGFGKSKNWVRDLGVVRWW